MLLQIFCKSFRYVGLAIWVLGVVGHVLTILTLISTRQFRSNTYSLFVIVASVSSTSILVPHLGTMIVSTFIGFIPRTTFTPWCKAFAYTNYFSTYVSITLLAVSTIDQWLSTSRNMRLRRFSSMRNVRIIIAGMLLFFSLLLIPHPNYSEILFDPTRSSTTCDRPAGIYRAYVNYGLVFFVHAISIIIMIVFGYLTHRHLATNNHGQIVGAVNIRHRINIQMIRTLFTQIILFIICSVPLYIVTILYPAFTGMITQRSAERMAIEMPVNNVSTLLYYVPFADTFYIFLIVSPTFRRNVKVLLRFPFNNNRVVPVVSITNQ